MTRFSRSRRLAAAAIAATAVLATAQAAQAEPPEPTIPQDIVVPAGTKRFLVGHAVGVQIYRCNATADGGYRWGFVGPRADLYRDNGKLIATHFAGPSWQAMDGSKVVGSLVRGVTVEPTAIPWLLLSATGIAGADGDRLAGTTFIQRINTTGGLIPPAEQCNPETVGNVNEVPYAADYHFWKATGA